MWNTGSTTLSKSQRSVFLMWECLQYINRVVDHDSLRCWGKMHWMWIAIVISCCFIMSLHQMRLLLVESCYQLMPLLEQDTDTGNAQTCRNGFPLLCILLGGSDEAMAVILPARCMCVVKTGMRGNRSWFVLTQCDSPSRKFVTSRGWRKTLPKLTKR